MKNHNQPADGAHSHSANQPDAWHPDADDEWSGEPLREADWEPDDFDEEPLPEHGDFWIEVEEADD